MHCCGITRYHNDIKKLKRSYPDIENDLRDRFEGLSFDEIFELSYRLHDSGISRIIKVRISNSHNQSGKSSGFRLYLIANSTENHVTFLTIYPKSNKGGKENLSPNELKEIITEFQAEKKKALLQEFDLISKKST